jgi:trk system potassium uptake protein TrkH
VRLVLVVTVIGSFLRLFGLAFVPPLILAAIEGEWTGVLDFLLAISVTVGLGTAVSFRMKKGVVLDRGEALAVVSGTWASVAICGAIPYLSEGLSVIDALFESFSGFTTTGATVLTDFSRYGRAFYLWRAMSQWFGGLGVIALFIVMLPRLGIAGRQLFFAEASGAPSEAVSPAVRHAASRLWMLYVALTLLLTALLLICGMGPYDALVHALTTMPAGGFSPHGQSIMGYDNPAAEWVLTVFMVIAGSSFPLLYHFLRRRSFRVLNDGEFLFYVGSTIVFGVAIAFVIAPGLPGEPELRTALFQAASIISSTGYASTDFNLWSDPARVLLVVLMVIGGCAGSAAGGPKVVRWLIVFTHVRRELTRTLHPRAVLPVRYKGKVVDPPIIRAVFSLVVLYVLGYFVGGVVMVVLGADLVTGFSAAIACLGNIGPGFGPAGPMGSFAGFSDAAKLVLTVLMWIGRLEIVAVIALLHPDVWRDVRLFRR